MVQLPSICRFDGTGRTLPLRRPWKVPTQFVLCARAGRAPPRHSSAAPSSRMAIQPRRALTLVIVPLVLNRVPLVDRSQRQGAETARVSDWRFGSPAVVEPERLFRPVTLRPHLSVGLPLSCPGSADRSGQIAFPHAAGRKSIG